MCALRLVDIGPYPEPEPEPEWGPVRSRAELVPLGDTPVAGDPWFLGATGEVAHRPARLTSLSAVLRQTLAPESAACGVFMTQVPASREITRCGLCLMVEPAPLLPEAVAG